MALLATVAGVGPVAAEKRVALSIGNTAYEHTSELQNAINDATAIESLLKKHGFHVVVGTNLSGDGLRKKVKEFAELLDDADTALLFYAGHGVQVGGVNYIVPVDAKLLDEDDLDFTALDVNFIIKVMERKARASLVFLDACRDNPLAGNLARSMGTRGALVNRGLAKVDAGVGTFISYATQPGNVTYDGWGGDGKNSPFTTALLRNIEITPDLPISQLMQRVRSDVISATQGKQVPWDNSSLVSSFRFHSPLEKWVNAKRFALVIGDSEFEHLPPRRTAANDARLIADALRDAGFEPDVAVDMPRQELTKRLLTLRRNCEENENSVCLLYISGLGLNLGRHNFILPVDARLDDVRDFPFETIPAREFVDVFGGLENLANIAIFDTFGPVPERLQSFGAGTRSSVQYGGMDELPPGTGLLIAYATRPRTIADDRAGDTSPFATALAEALRTPDVSFEVLLKRVRKQVSNETNGSQTPTYVSELTEDIYLNVNAE